MDLKIGDINIEDASNDQILQFIAGKVHSIEEHTTQQNGSIANIKKAIGLILLFIAALHGEVALKYFGKIF